MLHKDSFLEVLSVAVPMRIRSDGANLVMEMPAVSLLMVRVQPPLKSSVLRGSPGPRVRAQGGEASLKRGLSYLVVAWVFLLGIHLGDVGVIRVIIRVQVWDD